MNQRFHKDHFHGKHLYCNCDDPKVSHFFDYFSRNFRHLGLKQLTTTCYKNRTWDLFSQHDSDTAICLNYRGTANKDNIPSDHEISTHRLVGDGDFRSPECIDILKAVDIVVTNPPFSLFRDYVAQLIKHNKKFLIIGNKNAITYKEIFPLIKDDKMWVGVTPMGKDMLFDVPPDYAEAMIASKSAGSACRIVDGVVKARSQSMRFTNLDHSKRHEYLRLYKSYASEEYPTYGCL